MRYRFTPFVTVLWLATWAVAVGAEPKVYTDWPFSATETARRQAETAAALSQQVEVTNTIGMRLRLIPAGEFLMGSSETAARLVDAYKSYKSDVKESIFFAEYPQHRVRITRPWRMGIHEVTVGQFRKFVEAERYQTDAKEGGEGGWYWNGSQSEKNPEYTWLEYTDDHPVVNVSWKDAVAFCSWLSKKEDAAYRLPTEAEWEYACRAGTTTRYYHGDDPEGLARVGNVSDGTVKGKSSEFSGWFAIAARDGYVFAAPVGKFQPNAFGLHDMHGNVVEWCSDWYHDEYYSNAPLDDPKGPSKGAYRVFRGGSWCYGPWVCRSAFRRRGSPVERDYFLGFRVALSFSGR